MFHKGYLALSQRCYQNIPPIYLASYRYSTIIYRVVWQCASYDSRAANHLYGSLYHGTQLIHALLPVAGTFIPPMAFSNCAAYVYRIA